MFRIEWNIMAMITVFHSVILLYITQKRLTDAFKMTSCSTYTNGSLEDDDGAKHICKGRRVDQRSKGPKIVHMVYKIRK